MKVGSEICGSLKIVVVQKLGLTTLCLSRVSRVRFDTSTQEERQLYMQQKLGW